MPPVALPDLDGKTVKLRDYRGKATVLLFWNPGCGFCQQMVGDLKAWEEDKKPGASQLLLISSGTAEANRAMGLGSTVVLDPSFATAQAFGARGTPSAVLVDAKGKVASELAVGRPGVLALLGVTPDAPRQAGPSGGSSGTPGPVEAPRPV
jgi:peroxiredoxin